MTHPARPQWLRRPDNVAPGLAYGADYNPEQWPREVWRDDVRLMREAGVNIVSLGIFSWAKLQPAEHTWRFDWLDEVMGLLYDNGIAVDLATATASPPPWLTTKHPEILPVNERGETLWPGGRQHWRPTSPVFREHALALVEKMAGRYADHPALTAWHVSNELGCHNIYDYSDDAARAFRTWLQARYATVEALNHAWGTAFWSQEYSDWAQILPPRLATTHPNPTQQLDFKRFSSDALREHLRAERDILHRLTPDVPVTHNFMIMGGTKGMDYAAWAADIDFVSNDHYREPGPQALDELSFSANLTGNIAGGRPWFLMEHSTSAVNWQPINVAKKPGELARDSLTHVAHGADAVCFFQWRQSAAGAEKYHSAMVPHAGPDSDVFRSAAALGATLRELAPVAGATREQAPAAIVFHWESWWAAEADSHPTDRLRYRQEALDWYTAFLNLGIRADVVPLGTALDGYSLVVAPMLHVVGEPVAKELQGYVEAGGHLVTTYFSGIVDEHDHVWLGGHPGALRDLLGIRVEEFAPLLDTETVTLDGGLPATLWTERVQVTAPDVTVQARYATGEHAGHPAVTRRAVGEGSAAYVSTRLGPQGLTTVLDGLATAAGVTSELPPGSRGGVELTVRRRGEQRFAFLVNRTDQPLTVTDLPGEPLAGARGPQGELPLPPRGVRVVRLS
ncbi:beta-galactosidase [Catellatospora citrea]|uniref:Beta-galactosidase n=1 Tax=Catellatospora citrea TaxID=53366 RepID=A0A8J3KHW8_9ACTN|nr:beta-galactosidase [Catellatospora citrea]RKE11387.1 beta-galactosidase [Catellatospora citrea]GIG03233.1 beta-galactosidase [Catellatospora citrea]